jgi:uncharacterized protein (DUF952 family)
MIIIHITKRCDWEKAQPVGEYRSSSLYAQGFIHCSLPNQVVDVANYKFASQDGLVLLCIDETKLDAEVRYENLQGGIKLFPHIYGSVKFSAIIDVVDFKPQKDGKFKLPDKIQ